MCNDQCCAKRHQLGQRFLDFYFRFRIDRGGSLVQHQDGWVLQKHAVYAAMVEAMDTEIGRLLASLGPELARTNVIFIGDNGTGGDGKGQPTERGCRVPYIVNGPGIVKEIGESRELVDISIATVRSV